MDSESLLVEIKKNTFSFWVWASLWVTSQWGVVFTFLATLPGPFLTPVHTHADFSRQRYTQRPSQEEPGSGLTASAPVSDVSALACTNAVWPHPKQQPAKNFGGIKVTFGND